MVDGDGRGGGEALFWRGTYKNTTAVPLLLLPHRDRDVLPVQRPRRHRSGALSHVQGVQAKRCPVQSPPSPPPRSDPSPAVPTSATSATTEPTIPASTSSISRTPKVCPTSAHCAPSPHPSTVKSFNGCGYCKVLSLSSLRSPPSSPPSATVGSPQPETHRVQQPWLARLLPSPHPSRTPAHTARRLAHRQHRAQRPHAPRDKNRPRHHPRQRQPPPPHHLLRPCTTSTPVIHHPRSSQQHQQSVRQTLPLLLKDPARRHSPPRSLRRQSRPPEPGPSRHDPPRIRSAHPLSSPDLL